MYQKRSDRFDCDVCGFSGKRRCRGIPNPAALLFATLAFVGLGLIRLPLLLVLLGLAPLSIAVAGKRTCLAMKIDPQQKWVSQSLPIFHHNQTNHPVSQYRIPETAAWPARAKCDLCIVQSGAKADMGLR